MPRVLILIEDGDERVMAATKEELTKLGCRLREDWAELGGDRLGLKATRSVCVGPVANRKEAEAAVAAAVAGFGVVAELSAPPAVVAAFYEDLRRFGPVEWRDASWLKGGLRQLDAEQRRLLELLSAGASLQVAADLLGYSRRTIDRRLAAIREALGVLTTAEALALHHGSRAKV